MYIWGKGDDDKRTKVRASGSNLCQDTQVAISDAASRFRKTTLARPSFEGRPQSSVFEFPRDVAL